MAEDTIKTKDMPIVTNIADISNDDRLIASHEMDENSHATVGIKISALGNYFVSSPYSPMLANKSIFGTDEPNDDDGYDGDIYFQVVNDVIKSSYVKYDGTWLLIAISDDNWAKFLAGEPFDLISYDALMVKDYAFYQNEKINNIYLPVCTTIGKHAFEQSTVHNVYTPVIKIIDDYAFSECGNLRGDINISSVETIGDHAFYAVNSNYFGQSAIYCSIDFTNVKEIGSMAFNECNMFPETTVAEDLYLPECESIGTSAFARFRADHYIRRFGRIILPKIKTLADQSLRGFYLKGDMEVHIGPYIESMGDNAFYGDPIGSWSIYIEATTPPLIGSLSREWGSETWPGHIYVPASAVDTYKSNSNWSKYSDYISAIPEEG